MIRSVLRERRDTSQRAAIVCTGGWSAERSAWCVTGFCSSRTTQGPRLPRRYWVRSPSRDSLCQPTTRPPRIRSGSRLAVESWCPFLYGGASGEWPECGVGCGC